MKLQPRHLRFGVAAPASLAALAGTVLLLGGCGFTPLYASKLGVTPQLAAIDVHRPDGRTGYLLGDSLDDELGHDTSLPTKYRLQYGVHEVRSAQGINASNEATRYEVDLVVNYTLSDIKSGAQVTKGSVSVNATYNAAYQPYASMAASLDGEKRAAEAAAERIRLELASYFASPRPNPTVTPGGAITNTFNDMIVAQPVESPRQRALSGANPGAGDIPDPYATPGSAVTPDQP
jgi:LPS-assembly lipoprotein